MKRKAATVKKTYNLPQDLIARVQRILKVRTETEAIIQALEQLAYEDEIHDAIRRTGGKVRDVARTR